MMRTVKTVLVMLAVATLPSSIAAREMGPPDVRALPASTPTLVEPYGSDPLLQRGELRLPPGKGPFPVAIVIHGGCWTKGFDTARGTAPLATALTERGIATWNIDYRQIGDAGGGWPGTFEDWAAAADHLRALAKRYPLDLRRVITVGHSAGAHAALWVAARPKLARDSAVRGTDPLRIRAAVAIDGPGDLAPFIGLDAQICGKPVIVPLIGGTPDTEPRRYHDATPQALLPLGLPQTMVVSTVLSPEAAKAYRDAAAAKGDKVMIVTTPGSDHFNIISPGEPQAKDVIVAILATVPRR